MNGLTYDAGALVAAERNDRALWKLHLYAVRCDQRPTVPAAVLAQVWRGGPQPLLSRLLKDCDVEALDEALARKAGKLCGDARTADVIDAVVVIGAALRRERVVTSDPGDIGHLASCFGIRLELFTV